MASTERTPFVDPAQPGGAAAVQQPHDRPVRGVHQTVWVAAAGPGGEHNPGGYNRRIRLRGEAAAVAGGGLGRRPRNARRP
eukprot:5806458-Pleurochrysis_carterae.AAC.1